MTFIGLPIGFVTSHQIPVSAACLCVQAFDDLPPGKKIRMKISFPKGAEYETFRVETEMVWKEGYFWENWGGYHYASKSLEILNSCYLKMRRHFCGRSYREEALAWIFSCKRGASV